MMPATSNPGVPPKIDKGQCLSLSLAGNVLITTHGHFYS